MTSRNSSQSESVAYINGKVFTINSNAPWADGFIVSSDGIFEHVGTTKEIESIANKEHYVIHNLRGQFVMPGLHDAHVHMLFSAFAMTSQAQLPPEGLTNSNVVEELRNNHCLCKYAHVNEDWVIGSGYLVQDFDRKALDDEYPNTPVMIRGGAGHSAFLNTAALKRAGYDIENQAEEQGACYKRDANGHLTGEVAENGMSKVMTRLPLPGTAHVKRVLQEAQYALHRAGVTSCQEASANTIMLNAMQQMESEGRLKMEIFPHIVYAPDWIGEEAHDSLHALIDQAESYRSKHIDTRFVKIILDGVPLDPYWTHAALKDDGTVDPTNLIILNVHEAVQKYDERGMTMKIHCTGNGATRTTLDAFEAARKRNPHGPKHEIAHCSGVSDQDYDRFKQLNVTAEMSPAFFFVHPITQSSGGLMDWNFSKMLAAEAHITIGSDWGAGPVPDMIPHMANIVDTVGQGDKAAGGESICRMLTLAGAEAVGREKDLGSIEVGKKANFIAVDKNLAAGDFGGASVLKTWFEGEVVYEKHG